MPFHFTVYPLARTTVLLSDKLYRYRMTEGSLTHVYNARNSREKKLEQHLQVLASIFTSWRSHGIGALCPEQMVTWCLDFTLFDLLGVAPEVGAACARRLSSLLCDMYGPSWWQLRTMPPYVAPRARLPRRSPTASRWAKWTSCGFFVATRGLAQCVERVFRAGRLASLGTGVEGANLAPSTPVPREASGKVGRMMLEFFEERLFHGLEQGSVLMEELYFTGIGAGAGAGSGDGFFRIAAATPAIRVADVEGNAQAILDCVKDAASRGVGALALPELCLTGYTCADLFFDRTLLRACETALNRLLAETLELPILFTVGLPVAHGEGIYNCAAVCCAGQLLGLTAKENIPNYSEFYERRWFTPAPFNDIYTTYAGSGPIPMGARLVYRCADPGMDSVAIGVEICEDLWVPEPPSISMAAQGGATVILNLSASDETIGKAEYRRDLVRGQSARLYCAYAYADAGEGESTTEPGGL